MLIVALFTIAKTWKQLKCPSVDEWVKKMWYVYTIEHYLAMRKKELLPRVNLEGIVFNKINQTEKDKY